MGTNPENNQIAGAITYPVSSQNMQSVPVQPRQPRSLQGLLRFAMEATKAEDAPGNSEFSPMDEERRKFLEDALKSLTVNVAEVLQSSIKVLTDTEKIRSQLGEPLPSDVETAFDNLLDYIDDIDIANDFYKMGGFAIFPVCYGSENDEVRSRASSVLAEACQNNPHCQRRALDCGLLNVLIHLVQSERGHALAKCLYAISCICREYEPAARELVWQDGVAALAALLRAPEPAARTRAAFLVRHLAHHYSDAKEQFIQNNVVETVVEQIKSGRDDTTEHLLGILLALVEGLDPTVLQQCRNPRLNLKKVLEDHLKHPELEESYIEEKEYCQEILQQVFKDCPPIEVVDDEVTR
ncbi:hsp70-binding protein 1-like [Galleria mellonella]|uniref:Hsp70-binding protein 1-like n=1 Tax=Galleria mellonella TaxID=7137 RepID=A0ABM3MY83_GALME|nr:hsp70-binding protein 1-like [Galleria mellonella]